MSESFDGCENVDEEVTRYISPNGIFCEHCYDMADVTVGYNDGVDWCSWCAFANGYISENQLEKDKGEMGI